MPSGKEVLDIFNLHPEIVKSSTETRELKRDELRSNYNLISGQKNGKQFNMDIYYWFVERVGKGAIVCQCDLAYVEPAPCFILTHIAAGWVGGILYAK